SNNKLELLFFFSSRRRHTRSKRDWSSDVCSSDLLFQRTYHVHHGRQEKAGTGKIHRPSAKEKQGTALRPCRRRSGGKRSGRPLRSEERRVGKECRSRR